MNEPARKSRRSQRAKKSLDCVQKKIGEVEMPARQENQKKYTQVSIFFSLHFFVMKKNGDIEN